jgi:UDP-N-acetylmuramate dehydrogenase
MNKINENQTLKMLNTFGMDVNARFFTTVSSVGDVKAVFSLSEFKNHPKLIIGGGSNILFCRDFEGLVIKNEIKEIKKIREDENHIWVYAGAGENWHEFVLYCIGHNWSGIENLSLIPGCVGAAPMQNIGAYGVEVKDVIDSVHTIEIETLHECVFTNEECKFGYRESVFKNELKNKHVITGVTFRLSKNPDYKIGYGAIKEELEKEPNTSLSIKKISDAVIRIRKSKLPDPAVTGNAGSFFKNPEISKIQATELKNNFPGIVSYPANDEKEKLAAGWLIENAGWKGYTENNFGVHKLQALVLVNYGGANGKEIFELSEKIIHSVEEKFGVKLEREVNIFR